MSRKDPFRTVRIREAILDLLKPLLEGENNDQFRPLSLNAYCEKILWDYAQGKLISNQPMGRKPKVLEGELRGVGVRVPKRSVGHK